MYCDLMMPVVSLMINFPDKLSRRNTVQKVKEMYHKMDKLIPINLRKIQTLILMLVYLHVLLGFAGKLYNFLPSQMYFHLYTVSIRPFWRVKDTTFGCT